MKDRFSNDIRLNDWGIFDDITGFRMWASEVKLLETETGYGGMYQDANRAFAIDYGLVPYVIPPEKPVPFSRPNNTIPVDETEIPNLDLVDPMGL